MVQNALGSMCRNPCEGEQCYHETSCISESAWDWHCDCSTTKEPPSPPFSGYWGQNCQARCLKGGTTISTGLFWKGKWCYKCSCCCSQDSHNKWDVLGGFYRKLCGSTDVVWPNFGPCGNATKCGADGSTCCTNDDIHGGGGCGFG
jgi:hypothetical protein